MVVLICFVNDLSAKHTNAIARATSRATSRGTSRGQSRFCVSRLKPVDLAELVFETWGPSHKES